MKAKHTPGPWEYIAGTKFHGPYVVIEYGPTVGDLLEAVAPIAEFVKAAS